MEHYIQFPALGWEFPIDDTLVTFSLFGTAFSIKWYGLLIALGFILAVIYGLRRAKEFDILPDPMIDVALVATIMGFVGARLYYVFAGNQVQEYLANPIRILRIWEGGIGIYGGIIFAFLFGILMCRIKKVNVLAMCDLASLGFLIGQAIGRWGNFFNQEAFGGNTTLPWGMTGDVIQNPHPLSQIAQHYDPTLPVHPTFLYESLWCVAGFVLLHILSKKAYRFKGQLFAGYLMWYGIGRFFIESLRTDSLMLGPIRQSQLVAVLAVIAGGILMLVLARRRRRNAGVAVADTTDDPSPAQASEDTDTSTEDITAQEEETNDGHAD